MRRSKAKRKTEDPTHHRFLLLAKYPHVSAPNTTPPAGGGRKELVSDSLGLSAPSLSARRIGGGPLPVTAIFRPDRGFRSQVDPRSGGIAETRRGGTGSFFTGVLGGRVVSRSALMRGVSGATAAKYGESAASEPGAGAGPGLPLRLLWLWLGIGGGE